MNKGFTLVELMAVIAVLTLVLTFAIPAVLDSRKTIEEKVRAREKDNILMAAEIFALDLDDVTSDIYNCKSSSWTEGLCNSYDSFGVWNQVSISLKDLINNNYFKMQEECDAAIDITKNEAGYSVTLSEFTFCQF